MHKKATTLETEKPPTLPIAVLRGWKDLKPGHDSVLR
jgi:hypothetical protein